MGREGVIERWALEKESLGVTAGDCRSGYDGTEAEAKWSQDARVPLNSWSSVLRRWSRAARPSVLPRGEFELMTKANNIGQTDESKTGSQTSRTMRIRREYCQGLCGNLRMTASIPRKADV